jgi:preprotein translocase subunit SecE
MGVRLPPPLPRTGEKDSPSGDKRPGRRISKTMKLDMAEELAARKGSLTRFREYVAEVRAEMRRVTWPGKQEIYSTTVMVIITTFLFGAYFMVCDRAFSTLMLKILNYFSHRP